MTNNRLGHIRKIRAARLIAAALLITALTSNVQAANSDLVDDLAKSAGKWISKSSMVQQGIELLEPLFPEKVVEVRRYIPPATIWGRFKQKCSEFLQSLTKCFGSTNGDSDD